MSGTEPAVKAPEGDRELTQDPRKLRRRRQVAGLSLRALAEESGINLGHICALENGRHSARPATLAALAKAMGCSIEDLMPPEDRAGAA